MSSEFFWRLPLGSDGHQLSTDLHDRGSFSARPGHIAPGRTASGSADGFTYIDYIAQVAKAAELAGFEGALLPTGPEPWIAAAALARETRRLRFLVAFQAAWTLPAYVAQQAAILQHLSHGRLDWNIITGGNPASQRAHGDFLDHDQRYRRTDEFLDIIDGLWRHPQFSYEGEVYRLEHGSLPEELRHERKPAVYFWLLRPGPGRCRPACRRLPELGGAGGGAQAAPGAGARTGRQTGPPGALRPARGPVRPRDRRRCLA